MNKKGYTIMEAVIAMFLVVVMVGAVFSALMSSRRAIVSSSEKEEILYSINSAYALLKDCRSNPHCHLQKSSCNYDLTPDAGDQSLVDCSELFTFNFGNICKNNAGTLSYSVRSSTLPETMFFEVSGDDFSCSSSTMNNFITLNINANCSEV